MNCQLGIFAIRMLYYLKFQKAKRKRITKEDLEPYADILAQVSFAFLRTGFEKYRTENPLIYQNEEP